MQAGAWARAMLQTKKELGSTLRELMVAMSIRCGILSFAFSPHCWSCQPTADNRISECGPESYGIGEESRKCADGVIS